MRRGFREVGPFCHGYANCCSCTHCLHREHGEVRALREIVRRRLDTGTLDTRGGPRQRREHRAMEVRRGDLRRFDFSKRQSGHGKAGHDKDSIREWLQGRQVEQDGRRWLLGGERVRKIEDYAPALRRGRKSEAIMPLYRDLVHRVADLDEDGAYKSHVAEVLGVPDKTIARLVESARRRKRP